MNKPLKSRSTSGMAETVTVAGQPPTTQPASESHRCPLYSVPNEILLHILSFAADMRTLESFGRSSSRLRRLYLGSREKLTTAVTLAKLHRMGLTTPGPVCILEVHIPSNFNSQPLSAGQRAPLPSRQESPCRDNAVENLFNQLRNEEYVRLTVRECFALNEIEALGIWSCEKTSTGYKNFQCVGSVRPRIDGKESPFEQKCLQQRFYKFEG